MAAKTLTIKKKLPSYAVLHKMMAGVALLAFCVVVVSGLRAGVYAYIIAYRAALAMVVIGIVSRIVIRVLITYEEIQSGKDESY